MALNRFKAEHQFLEQLLEACVLLPTPRNELVLDLLAVKHLEILGGGAVEALAHEDLNVVM